MVWLVLWGAGPRLHAPGQICLWTVVGPLAWALRCPLTCASQSTSSERHEPCCGPVPGNSAVVHRLLKPGASQEGSGCARHVFHAAGRQCCGCVRSPRSGIKPLPQRLRRSAVTEGNDCEGKVKVLGQEVAAAEFAYDETGLATLRFSLVARRMVDRAVAADGPVYVSGAGMPMFRDRSWEFRLPTNSSVVR